MGPKIRMMEPLSRNIPAKIISILMMIMKITQVLQKPIKNSVTRVGMLYMVAR